MRRGLAVVSLLAVLASSAVMALGDADAGTYLAVGDDGQPLGKVLRVSRDGARWRFEDRRDDGSWLDVSCHGGCEHRPSQVPDLVQFFGAPPPSHIWPDCVHNAEYAFCHLVTANGEREGYVLVVRAGAGWQPLSMLRVADDQLPAPAREAA